MNQLLRDKIQFIPWWSSFTNGQWRGKQWKVTGKLLLRNETTTPGVLFLFLSPTPIASDFNLSLLSSSLIIHFLLHFQVAGRKKDGALVRRRFTTGGANYKGRSNKWALCGVSKTHTHGRGKKVLFIFPPTVLLIPPSAPRFLPSTTTISGRLCRRQSRVGW